MTDKSPYNNYQVEKLGNTIIYLVERLDNKLYKTNLLKYLYIIEEASIKKFGIPFFNIDFKIWKLGPVHEELYYELNEGLNYFENYFKVEENSLGKYIVAKSSFDDDEFSENDIELLDEIIDTFKDYTSEQLINYTHQETKPWFLQATELGLIDLQGNLKKGITDVSIDFNRVLDDKSFEFLIYKSSQSSKGFFDSLI